MKINPRPVSRIIGAALLTAGGFAGVAQAETPAAQTSDCVVGENSRGACVGKWVFFVGNNQNLDEGVWVVRIDRETGEVWHKNGKWMVKLRDKE